MSGGLRPGSCNMVIPHTNCKQSRRGDRRGLCCGPFDRLVPSKLRLTAYLQPNYVGLARRGAHNSPWPVFSESPATQQGQEHIYSFMCASSPIYSFLMSLFWKLTCSGEGKFAIGLINLNTARWRKVDISHSVLHGSGWRRSWNIRHNLCAARGLTLP